MKSKNILSIVLTVLLASALIALGVYAYRGWQTNNGEEPAGDQSAANGDLIGGQTDEHGCLIAAGYSWCEAEQKCLRSWEETCGPEPAESDLTGIKQAFMNKYDKTADEIQVTVNLFDGTHARGGVKFSMNGNFGEGGIFLAYQEGGDWKIAFDGNGMYSCSAMAQYNFPDEMIPDCADGNPGALDSAQLANPASVYCQEQGGTTEIRANADGSQYGVCKFSDGSECDEWAFYRHECQPGNN
jgi:putative hemolysin